MRTLITVIRAIMNFDLRCRCFLVVLGLSLLPLPGISQSTQPQSQSFIDHILDKKFWYGVYISNTHGGYATATLKTEKYNGEEVYVFEESLILAEQTDLGGVSLFRQSLYFSRPTGLMVGCLTETFNDGEKADSLSGTMVNGKWIISDYSNIKRVVDLNTFTIDDFFDNETWIRGEPTVGSTNVYHDFDCETYEFTRTVSTVVKKGERKISGKTITYISTHDLSEDLDIHQTFAADGVGLQASMGKLSIKLQDEKSAKSYNKLGRYWNGIPLNEDIERHDDLSELRLEISGVTQGDIKTGFNQKVIFKDNGVVELTLGADSGTPMPVDNNDVDQFLKATAQYPTDHPIIRDAFSNMKIEGPLHEYILAYVSNILVDDYNSNASNAVDILKNKKGDCSEHSLLFVTLARLAGIPAREVFGVVYNGDSEHPGLAGHAWAEIALGGYWVAVDPTWGVMSTTHIKIEKESALLANWDVQVVGVSYHSVSEDMADDAYERHEDKKAFSLYEEQALLGKRHAQYSLGWMYLKGEGVSKNELEALKWLRLAANKGHIPSMYVLGAYYLADDSMVQDELLSTFWFYNAASRGDLMAAYYVGEAYEKGLGVRKNINEALFWYKESAQSAF